LAIRSFGAKARAFQRGLAELNQVNFDYIGNLDADVTFGPNYYSRMLEEMQKNRRLGVASGVCWDKTSSGFKLVTISLNHAVGAVQFFRRECFEAIGGYKPTTVGGVDSLAELTARMKGWETRAFQDLPFYHHKPVDSANARSAARVCYRAGQTEYHIGTHPLFAVAKAIRRWCEKPVLLSPAIRLWAYSKLWISGAKRDAPDDLVAYLKQEQLAILRNTLLLKKQNATRTTGSPVECTLGREPAPRRLSQTPHSLMFARIYLSTDRLEVFFSLPAWCTQCYCD
jgi:GT2 family glycosyltransferase